MATSWRLLGNGRVRVGWNPSMGSPAWELTKLASVLEDRLQGPVALFGAEGLMTPWAVGRPNLLQTAGDIGLALACGLEHVGADGAQSTLLSIYRRRGCHFTGIALHRPEDCLDLPTVAVRSILSANFIARSDPGLAVSDALWWLLARVPDRVAGAWRRRRPIHVQDAPLGVSLESCWRIMVPDATWADGCPDACPEVLRGDGAELVLRSGTSRTSLSARLRRGWDMASSITCHDGMRPGLARIAVDTEWLPPDVVMAGANAAVPPDLCRAADHREAAEFLALRSRGLMDPDRAADRDSALRATTSGAWHLLRGAGGYARSLEDVVRDLTTFRMAAEEGNWCVEPAPDRPMAMVVPRRRCCGDLGESWSLRARRPRPGDTLRPDVEVTLATARMAGVELVVRPPDTMLAGVPARRPRAQSNHRGE